MRPVGVVFAGDYGDQPEAKDLVLRKGGIRWVNDLSDRQRRREVIAILAAVSNQPISTDSGDRAEPGNKFEWGLAGN